MAKREINDYSEARANVVRHLRTMQPGEETSYDEMERKCGLPPGSREFAYVFGSATRALREEGLVFTRRKNRVVRRLTDEEVVALSERGLFRIQDTARRIAIDAERASRSNALSPDVKTAASVVASVATVVAAGTSAAAIEQVRAEVQRTGSSIALRDTLALFSRPKPDRSEMS